jgi:hypothetical protein
MLLGKSRSRYIWSCQYLYPNLQVICPKKKDKANIPYLVVRLEPSWRVSLSIVIACAGQIASHNLQARGRVSPRFTTYQRV